MSEETLRPLPWWHYRCEKNISDGTLALPDPELHWQVVESEEEQDTSITLFQQLTYLYTAASIRWLNIIPTPLILPVLPPHFWLNRTFLITHLDLLTETQLAAFVLPR